MNMNVSMKKTKSGPLILLASALVATFGVLGEAGAVPIVSIDPPNSTVALGDSFSVAVAISDASDVYAYQFDLLFDGALLQANEVTEGGFLSGTGSTFFLPGSIDNAAGQVSNNANALLGPIAGATGGGTLASIAFSSLLSGVSELSISNVLLLDSKFNLLDSAIVNGSVQIAAPVVATVPEPGTAALFALGAVMFGLIRRRDQKQGIGSVA